MQFQKSPCCDVTNCTDTSPGLVTTPSARCWLAPRPSKSTPDFVPFQTSGRSDKAPVHYGLSATWHMCTNTEIPVDGVRFPSMPQPLRTGRKQDARGWHQQQLVLDAAAAFIAYTRTVFNQINHIMRWKTSRRAWRQHRCRDNRNSGGVRTDDLRQMSILHFLCLLHFFRRATITALWCHQRHWYHTDANGNAFCTFQLQHFCLIPNKWKVQSNIIVNKEAIIHPQEGQNTGPNKQFPWDLKILLFRRSVGCKVKNKDLVWYLGREWLSDNESSCPIAAD